METNEYRRLCEEGARTFQKVMGPGWKCEPVSDGGASALLALLDGGAS